MSEKEEAGHCWVVRWRMEEKSSVLQEFLHVLPWRWKSEKVEEYLFSLYYNSPTTPLSERTGWMNSKVRTGLLVIKEEKRVIVGEGPFLVANLVTDSRSLMIRREVLKSCLILNHGVLDSTLREERFLGTVHLLR